MTRKHAGIILRIVISIVGIAWVVYSVDLRAAASSLLAVNVVGFVSAVVIFQIGIFVRAVRWWVLLRSHAEALPIWKLVRLYYFGMFFNLFLPTGFGGDVVRAAELGAEVDSATSAATVLLDRMLGLMALFAIALAAAPFVIGVVPGTLLAITAGISLVGLVGGGLVLHGRLFAALLSVADAILGRLPLASKVLDALRRFNDAIAIVGRDTRAVAQAFGISLVFNALLILIHVILSSALGMDVPAAAYIIVVPLTSILLLVPSIAGIGVRESAFVYLLEFFTTNVAKGAALGVVVLMQNIISGVIGWAWYMLYSLRRQDVPQQKNASQPNL